MPKLKLMLIALLLLLPTACATSDPPSKTPSIVPTVMCGEEETSDPLPDYPAAPNAFGPDALMAYIRAQSDWAVQAAGIYRREHARRVATESCLASLRKRGLIN